MHDQKTWELNLQPGDKVLFLLPSSTKKIVDDGKGHTRLQGVPEKEITRSKCLIKEDGNRCSTSTTSENGKSGLVKSTL